MAGRGGAAAVGASGVATVAVRGADRWVPSGEAGMTPVRDRAAEKALAGVPTTLRALVAENDGLLAKLRGYAAANDWEGYEAAALMFVAHADVCIRALADAHALLVRAWPTTGRVQ